jgi:DNA polymerase III alpha subunit (gram-positive type)
MTTDSKHNRSRDSTGNSGNSGNSYRINRSDIKNTLNTKWKLIQREGTYFVHMLLGYVFMVISIIINMLSKFIKYIQNYQPTIVHNKIFYFDFETTGLNPYHNKIIDYAFLKEDYNDIMDMSSGEDTCSDETSNYITSLVNPKTKFEKKITDITGIYPEELEDKQPIENHKHTIRSYICSEPVNAKCTQSYFIAHNCDGFDRYFLQRIFPSEQLYRQWKYIDTLLLAKKLLPNIPSYSLSNLSKHYTIKAGTHRALSDTICLRKVYHMLLHDLASHMNTTHIRLLRNPEIVYDYIYN